MPQCLHLYNTLYLVNYIYAGATCHRRDMTAIRIKYFLLSKGRASLKWIDFYLSINDLNGHNLVTKYATKV